MYEIRHAAAVCACNWLVNSPCYRHRPPCSRQIGNVKVGSEHKIALQTMTTTDTRNVEATVEQVKIGRRSGEVAWLLEQLSPLRHRLLNTPTAVTSLRALRASPP